MKRILLITMIVTFAVMTISGQQKSSSIYFKYKVYDFGTIKEEDGIVTCSFEFNNSSKAPLIIQRIITTCDCTTTEWTKEPLVPGASGFIKVAFNPKDRPGKFDKTITVYSNAETSTVVLQIKGVVKERPKSLEDIYNRLLGDFRFKGTNLSFSRIFADQIKVDTLEFINVSKESVKIGCKLEGLTHLKVKFVPETLKPMEKGFMIVTFDAKKRNDWGFVIDRFYLTQNDTDISGGIISVSASIEENFSSLTDEQRNNAPKIELAKTNYDFGQIDEGQPVESEFTFENSGKNDLIIRKIKPSCGCTTVEPVDKIVKPGQTSSFKSSIKTTGFTGRISKSITIITNDPATPSVSIHISGVVNPPKK